MPLCRHNDGMEAVARFRTPEGCICFPEDKEQDLCAQHIVKWGVNGTATVIKIYWPKMAEMLGINDPS
jgi:hypothetical protein